MSAAEDKTIEPATPVKSSAAKSSAAKSSAAKSSAAKKPVAAAKPSTKKPAATKEASTKKATELKIVAPKITEPEFVVPDALEAAEHATLDRVLDLGSDTPGVVPDATDATRVARSKARMAQASALAARMRARGQDTFDGIEARRADWRTIDSVFTAAEHDSDVGGGILSAAVAFRLFLFMVPLAYVLVVAFGIGTDVASEDTGTAARSAGAIGLLAKSFASVAGRSTGGRIVSLFVGGFAVWLTARSALKVLRMASALTWRVPLSKLARPSRATLLFIGTIVGAVAISQLLGVIRDASFRLGIVATVLFVLVPTSLWLLFCLRAFPHPEDAGWKAMLPGAILVGIGLQCLQVFTILVIARQVESKSQTYGAIGVALAMLFWAYLMGRILTAGNVLNAALWYRDHPRPNRLFGQDGDDGDA